MAATITNRKYQSTDELQERIVRFRQRPSWCFECHLMKIERTISASPRSLDGWWNSAAFSFTKPKPILCYSIHKPSWITTESDVALILAPSTAKHSQQWIFLVISLVIIFVNVWSLAFHVRFIYLELLNLYMISLAAFDPRQRAERIEKERIAARQEKKKNKSKHQMNLLIGDVHVSKSRKIYKRQRFVLKILFI